MVAFDSVGPSSAGSGGASPRTYTHTTVAAGTKVLVGASIDGVAAGATVTCTLGGVAMTSLGQVAAAGGTTGIVQAWTLDGVSAGAHTIVVTCATAADIECGSIAFSSAGALGTPVTASGASITASASVTASSSSLIAAFTAVGDTIVSSANTSRFINNFEGGAGQATGNAAGSTAAGTGSPVTMSWTLTGATDSWAVIAVEVQNAQPPQPPVPLPLLPPGWFPGADAVTDQPGGVPFWAQPAPADATPAVIIPPTPEAAPVTPVPPGWFPGSDRVTATPGGVPFEQLPVPLTPAPAVIFPTPEVAGEPEWLPLPPGWFPGASLVTTDPGSIPFYSLPQPQTPPPAPPPVPVITGLSGTGLSGYFTDQNGSPRLYMQDVPWGLPANAGRWNGGNWAGDIVAYLSSRAAQGFTAIRVNLFGQTKTGGVDDSGSSWDGINPFTTTNDPSSGFNNAYWQRVDFLFAQAAAYGIAVEAVAAFRWWFDPTIFAAGWTNTQCSNFGLALGARYKSYANVLWFFGDDYGGQYDTQFTQILTGMRASGDAHKVTIEYFATGSTSNCDLSGSPAATPFAWGGANADYNLVYYYEPTYFGIEFAYQETGHPVPVIWGDGYYYGDAGVTATDNRLDRNFAWWALASGARGISTGSDNIQLWGSGSPAAVTTDGWFASEAPNVRQAFESLPGWHRLLPDLNSALVIAGRGTRAAYSNQFYLANTDNYVAASRTPDGSLAVIYCAAAFSITIDQSKLGAGYTVTWIDPASGAQSAGTPGATYNSAAQGSNSAGGADWVLALQGPPVTTVSAPGSPVIPLAPGWFPGSDRVTAVPGGVPFAQPPADPSFAAAGAATVQGSAALSGMGTLTASVTIGAAAALSGTGTLTASPVLAGSAALTGLGTLTAAPVLAGTATLSGAGTLTAAPQLQGTATLSGAGTLTAAPQLAGAAALSGTGTLTVFWTYGATVALSGSGTLSVSQNAGSATLTGLGTLTAAPLLQGGASLSGLGTLAAAWTLRQVAALTGAGTLTAAGAVVFPASAVLSGAGTLTVAPAFQVARSTPSVTARDTSAASVTDPRDGTNTVTATATSAPGVT